MPTTCPMCGEEVYPNDEDCPYCGEDLLGSGGRKSYGLWRAGKILVMEQDAELPYRCIKSNGTAQHRLTRTLSWHHPALLLILPCLGPVIFVIVSLCVRKQATVEFGLSEVWNAKRKRAMLIGWGLALLAVGMFAGSIPLIEKRNDLGPFVMIGAVLVLLVGAVYGLSASRMVSPKRITTTHVWLKGACPEYLDDLPQWQGDR